jgi:16S rRNA (cytosine1402-N4)-methyltransferase
LNEAIGLLINKDLKHHVIVDGTLGGGGYTGLICEVTDEGDRILSIDKDLNSIEYSKRILSRYLSRIDFVNGNFGDIGEILMCRRIESITGLVLDLGLSTFQLEEEEGFSFMKNTVLDMRAGKEDSLTASDVLNDYSREKLTEIFEKYGEIGNAKRLSNLIVTNRKKKKLEMTFDLVEAITGNYKISKRNLIDFLAKIFQAIRIEVNDELNNLIKGLTDSIRFFETGGRIAVVSYHSLEDRIVKNFFREWSSGVEKSEGPYPDKEKEPVLKILTKKPVVPTSEEIRSNSRSRSAKLRAAQIIKRI